MGYSWKLNTMNQVAKGTVIFEADEIPSFIGMIIKGKVAMCGTGVRVVLGTGCFVGITDVYMGRYLSTYKTLDDTLIYVFPVKDSEGILEILQMNKDYHGLMVASQIKFLAELSKAREELVSCAKSILQYLINSSLRCEKAAEAAKLKFTPVSGLSAMQPYEEEHTADESRLCYYKECAAIPIDIQKSYFSYSIPMSMQHIQEISGLTAQIMVECMETSQYIEEVFSFLFNRGEDNLLQKEAALALELSKFNNQSSSFSSELDSAIDEINRIELLFEERAGKVLVIDRDKMERLYMSVLTGEASHMESPEEKEQQVKMDEGKKQDLTSLRGAMGQIMTFGEMDESQQRILKEAVDYLVKAADRLSQEEEIRLKKKVITTAFFELYQNILLKSFKMQDLPKAVELFIDFGFLDERLLSEEQLTFLLNCKMEQTEIAPCPVYTIREWLTLIYQKKKDPSKNEFDEDYIESLRTRKRQGDITDEEEQSLLSNSEERLSFEIKNMFLYNNRVVNGQPSTYVPILYKEMFYRSIETMYTTKQAINEAAKSLLEIDYSAFYRETVYSKPELGIQKEYIASQVFPDMIILPMVGVNASMWQEIAGKRRNSPGRFIFPRFTETSLKDLMVKMFGRFRWELCRTLQGAAWNNIKYKSLTSEYMDYLQFYRKNHDLSEERKEKLKLQIQRGRNNSREIFLMDYDAWITGESDGAMKLNKIAREMLATYVPFSKFIRDKLKGQPLFEEAATRYQREKVKKIRELELRFRVLEKENVVLTEELLQTMKFYKDM